MDEFFKGFGLLALWAVFALLGKLGEKKKGAGKRDEGGGGQPSRPSRSLPGRAEASRGAPTTLEELLAEMQGRTASAPIEADDEVPTYDDDLMQDPPYERPAESPTWNTPVSPEGRSWNDPVVVISRDADAERTVQRRITEAAARDRSWRLADHEAFDIKIRAPKVAPDARAQLANHRRLRDAILLSEVLGPPKGLRDL